MNSVTLFVMSQKGFAVLQYVAESYRELLEAVVTSSDSNVEQDYYKEIKEYCKKNDIPCFDRKDQHTIDTAYAFTVSWRWIIPQPNFKLIVFHDSLLPKYRGFNSLVSMLINEEKRIGVTALFASEKYDQGDIIAQSSTEIMYPIKINEAIKKITENYKELAGAILESIKKNESITVKRQDNKQATYSLWRDEDDYRINWEDDSDSIKRFIDAVGLPYRGASSIAKNKEVRILDAEEVSDVIIENRVPGKVIFIENGYPVVVCGKGMLKIINITDEFNKSLLPFANIRTRFH